MPKFAAILIALAGLATAADWRYYGSDPGNSRYPRLKEINTANVSRLKAAWTAINPTGQ